MKIRSLFPVAGFAAAAIVGVGIANFAQTNDVTQIVVIEHATTDVVTDTGDVC